MTNRLVYNNKQIIHILEGCRRNDRKSQEELYTLLEGYAIKICIIYTKSYEEAEEIRNEAFLKLFKNIGKFEALPLVDVMASLKGWFKRILINTCIDHSRKKMAMADRFPILEDNNIQVDAETIIDKLSYKELHEGLIEMIRQLSPAYRAVFNLFVLEEFTHEEISERLGISVGTSKSNLSRARDLLRKLILKKNSYKNYA